jgi:hypothetical protein
VYDKNQAPSRVKSNVVVEKKGFGSDWVLVGCECQEKTRVQKECWCVNSSYSFCT